MDGGDDRLARMLLLRNAAVSTSGDLEQFVEIDGKRYSHIVDPSTGVGLTERLQVSIVSRRAMDTDAFATAASVLGVERGLGLVESRPYLAAIFIRKSVMKSEVFCSKRLDSYLERGSKSKSESGRANSLIGKLDGK